MPCQIREFAARADLLLANGDIASQRIWLVVYRVISGEE
jgi:hypothetical protein